MDSLNRRAFTKLSAAAAAIAVAPLVAFRQPGASTRPPDGKAGARATESQHQSAQEGTLQSQFLMNLTLETQTPHKTGAACGDRLIVPVSGGTFEGPRLKGTIISPGGDWIVERPDGSRVLDLRILLQTDDGQMIYVSWRGIAYTPPGGELFARILPLFETAAPGYAWLNNVVSVGVYHGGGKIAYRIHQIL
jgi:hypothetical protein